jgi:hypothetical protein
MHGETVKFSHCIVRLHNNVYPTGLQYVRFTVPLTNTQLHIDVQFPAAVAAFLFPAISSPALSHSLNR